MCSCVAGLRTCLPHYMEGIGPTMSSVLLALGLSVKVTIVLPCIDFAEYIAEERTYFISPFMAVCMYCEFLFEYHPHLCKMKSTSKHVEHTFHLYTSIDVIQA